MLLAELAALFLLLGKQIRPTREQITAQLPSEGDGKTGGAEHVTNLLTIALLSETGVSAAGAC